MSTQMRQTMNDVPPFLNDLIPYRCPKCGHQRRFATLRELRMHLQNDHAFQMGCIKPQSRTSVFSKSSSSKFSTSQDNEKKLNTFSRTDDAVPVNERNNQGGFREASPLLRTFKDETNILEMELQRAKQNEMRNKTLSIKKLTDKDADPEFTPAEDDTLPVRGRQIQHVVHIPTDTGYHAPRGHAYTGEQIQSTVHMQVDMPADLGYHTPRGRPYIGKQIQNTVHMPADMPADLGHHEPRGHPCTGERYPDSKSTLDKLNAEVMRSRLNQWVTSDALYKSQDILLNMEEAADANVREQQGIIHQLINDIKTKGDSIERREREQRDVQDERQRLFEQTERVMQDADKHSKDLQHELNQRGLAVEHLTTDMKRLQSISEQQLRRKDQDLQSAMDKMRRLEWERDRLIEETETILKRTDTDNVDLRNTIKAKEHELNTVNRELNNLRQNHDVMVEQTAEVQARAEESKNLMKSVIDAKNSQLESAVRQLNEMKAIHGQLLEESKILTEQADENTNSMTRLLQIKEGNVRELSIELQRLREEKYLLEESTSSLEEEREKKSTVIESLKDVVKSKEKDLQTTQSELADLKEFLQSAAAKERGARKKLEKFIDDLIQRAERAESELRTLRSQSTNASETSALGPHPKREQSIATENTVQIQLNEKSLLKQVPNDSPTREISHGISESSARYSLPSRLSPPKPPRTKLLSQSQADVKAKDPDENTKPNEPDKTKPRVQRNVIHTTADVHRQEDTQALETNTLRTKRTVDNDKTATKKPENRQPVGAQPPISSPNLPRDNNEQNDDSNTINTESLIAYLNEGLLSYVDNDGKSPRRNAYTKSPRGVITSIPRRELGNPEFIRNVKDPKMIYANNDNNTDSFDYPAEPHRDQIHRDPYSYSRGEYIHAMNRQSLNTTIPNAPYSAKRLSSNSAYMYNPPEYHRPSYIPRSNRTMIPSSVPHHGRSNVHVGYDRRDSRPVRDNRITNTNNHTDQDYGRSNAHVGYDVRDSRPVRDNGITNTSNHTDQGYRRSNAHVEYDNRDSYHVQDNSRMGDTSNYTDHGYVRESHQYTDSETQNERRRLYDKRGQSKGRAVPSAYRHSGVGKSKGSDSPKHKSTTNTKVKRRNRKPNLRQFDSRFPEAHTSMHDLHSIQRGRSGDRYVKHSRRSRSMSPDVYRQTKPDQTTYKNKEETVKSSGNETVTEGEVMQEQNEESDSQKYALLEESEDQNSQGFVEMMDENGIMWASHESHIGDANVIGAAMIDDADTLPDISDSELDRVSPSGSEAIATKKTNPISKAVTATKAKLYDPDSQSSTSRKTTSNRSIVHRDLSKSTQRSTMSGKERDASEHGNRYKSNSQVLKGKRIVRISKTNQGELVNERATFKPIKQTSSPIRSASEKDMTSGGKEVDDYIRKYSPKSPKVYVTSLSEHDSGTDKIMSSSLSSSRADMKSRESLEDKLARISDKYKSQRVVIGAPGKDPQRGALPVTGNTVDSKVNLINEKYKAKRQAIVDNKGVGVLTKDAHRLYNNTYSGRTSTHLSGHGGSSANTTMGTSFDSRQFFPGNREAHSSLAVSSPHSQYAQHIHGGNNLPCSPHQVGLQHATHLTDFENGQVLNTGTPLPNVPASVVPTEFNNGQTLNPGVPFQNVPYMPGGVPFNSPGLPPTHVPHGLHGQAGQMYNPYHPNYTNPGGNGSGTNQTFPYLFPYFHPMYHSGLQSNATHESTEHAIDGNNIARKNVNTPLSSEKPMSTDDTKDVRGTNKHDKDVSYSDDTSYKNSENTKDQNDVHRRDTAHTATVYSGDAHITSATVEHPTNMTDMYKSHTPMTMKESDIETERQSFANHSHTDKRNSISYTSSGGDKQVGPSERLQDTPLQVEPVSDYFRDDNDSSCLDVKAMQLSTESVENFTDGRVSQLQSRGIDLGDTSISEGVSMFAVPIEDDLSATCNSNTQSMIDMQGSGVETDLDTDTESVKRDFHEKARKIRGMLGELPDDEDIVDSVSQRSYRNAMSSASSQASIDFLDNIPTSRREETKRRRQALSSIFNFLDTASLCKVSEVCREWKIVSRSPKLWKRIELRNEKVSSKFLFFLARRSPQLRVLIIEDIRPRNRRQGETVEDYQTSLKCSLDGAVEQILKRSEASLHTISIINCGTLLSSKCLWAASCYSRMLRHVTYVTDFDPTSSEVMWALGSGCRDLKTLVVHPVNPSQNAEKFNTRCAQLIGKCFPVLEKLSVGGKHIDISALVFIAKQCQKLRHVELHHMLLLTKDIVEQMCDHGCKNIKVLKLMSTPIEPEGITTFYEECKYLDTIHLRLSVNDYFTGTGQTEDLKLFEDVTKQYEELKRDRKLGRILKLKINKI